MARSGSSQREAARWVEEAGHVFPARDETHRGDGSAYPLLAMVAAEEIRFRAQAGRRTTYYRQYPDRDGSGWRRVLLERDDGVFLDWARDQEIVHLFGTRQSPKRGSVWLSSSGREILDEGIHGGWVPCPRGYTPSSPR